MNLPVFLIFRVFNVEVDRRKLFNDILLYNDIIRDILKVNNDSSEYVELAIYSDLKKSIRYGRKC